MAAQAPRVAEPVAPVPRPARPREAVRARPRARAKLPTRLIVFAICLAILAIGRVTLSFAVVQKNMATSAVLAQSRALTAENADLAARVARDSSTLRVRTIAVDRLGLVPAQNVLYLSLPPRAARPSGDRTR